MKAIRQNVEIEFKAIDLQDAITLVPLTDNLEDITNGKLVGLIKEQANDIFNVLSSFGFVPTHPRRV